MRTELEARGNAAATEIRQEFVDRGKQEEEKVIEQEITGVTGEGKGNRTGDKGVKGLLKGNRTGDKV